MQEVQRSNITELIKLTNLKNNGEQLEPVPPLALSYLWMHLLEH